ncbi:hypothetical protein M514_00216 [Trichuris suis]|uniref:Uncharacterized protein n=1 Tax=Trichuris suis TaxID=68888 RepID=A0A085NUE9_9BILA|nr:hypothetical protein M513_00216 [Trichuris suis]KFD73095.1 hypothetical protein M514_00216 [Trichuris suis]KHJ46117.1 hypothetical protein D918_03781 [Trichuris suis]
MPAVFTITNFYGSILRGRLQLKSGRHKFRSCRIDLVNVNSFPLLPYLLVINKLFNEKAGSAGTSSVHLS